MNDQAIFLTPEGMETMRAASEAFVAVAKGVASALVKDPAIAQAMAASIATQGVLVSLMSDEDTILNEYALNGIAEGIGRQLGSIPDDALRIAAVNTFGAQLIGTVNQISMIQNTQGSA